MDVRDCPKCGSSAINKSSSSFEYGGSTTWSCEDCAWRYKRGRGIGTGTGNSGTHPRELSGGDQQTLTETGEYCSNCETVVAGEHACTPSEVLANVEDEVLSQEAVIDALSEWHRSPQSELEDAVSAGSVALTPTFYRVTEMTDDPEMFDVILDEIERIIDEQTPDDNEGPAMYWNADRAKPGKLKRRLAAETDVERAFIDWCLTRMERQGILSRTMEGIAPRG